MRNKWLFIVIAGTILQVNAQEQPIFSNEGDLSVSPGTQVSTYHAFVNKSPGNVFNNGELHFYNDYSNNGLFTYSTNSVTGYVVFEGKGASVQQLTGDKPSRFYDVLFNKPGASNAFNVTHEVLVAHQSDFTNGVVLVDKSQGGAFVFLKGSGHINTADKSHVEGEVTKEGNNNFTYPIGKSGYYRFASISAVESEAGSYLGEYFLRNSSLDHPHAHRTGVIEKINDKEYWSITRGPSTEGSVILTLSWDERTTPADMYSNQGKDLHIVRWDAKQSLWVDEGGIVDYAARTVTSPVKVDDLGIFTLGRVKSGLINDGDIVIYNGVSPDGDGKNDYFIIDNIQQFPNNTVTIFNRWGREVWTTQNYDSSGNVFKGYAQGVKTFKNGEKLPTGTYYYILEYLYERNGESRMIKKAGYLHLENN